VKPYSCIAWYSLLETPKQLPAQPHWEVDNPPLDEKHSWSPDIDKGEIYASQLSIVPAHGPDTLSILLVDGEV
jgi:hypothetical protein